MYCKVARRGGGTTFTKADVFVKPTKGQATFFSYKGQVRSSFVHNTSLTHLIHLVTYSYL